MKTLLTDENGKSKSNEHMKGVLPWLVRRACRAGTRDFFPALAAQDGPVHKIFVHLRRLFYVFVPVAQQAGQADIPCRRL
jgi:hypothetical protein